MRTRFSLQIKIKGQKVSSCCKYSSCYLFRLNVMPFLSVKDHPARLALYHCIMRVAHTDWSALSLSGWRWISGYTASSSSCYIVLHASHLFNRPVSSLPDLLAMFAVTMTTISVSISILQRIPQKPVSSL